MTGGSARPAAPAGQGVPAGLAAARTPWARRGNGPIPPFGALALFGMLGARRRHNPAMGSGAAA
jgi:hypothetical protein